MFFQVAGQAEAGRLLGGALAMALLRASTRLAAVIGLDTAPSKTPPGASERG